MPRVPIIDNISVGVQRSPTTLNRNPVTVEIATAQSRQMQQMGQGLQKFGADVTNQEIKELSRMNKIRAQDASNQLALEAQRLALDPNEGYANIKGQNVFERPDGQPLMNEYANKFDQKVGDFAEGLSNPAQKEAFLEEAAQMRGRFQQGILKHEADEARTYTASVNNTTMKLGAEGMLQNRRDIDLVYANAKKIQDAAFDTEFNLDGGDRVGAQLKARDAVSKTHKALLIDELNNPNGDVMFADRYFKKFGGPDNMDPADAIDVGNKLRERLNKTAGVNIASEVAQSDYRLANPDSIQRALNIDPTMIDKALAITSSTESNNRNYDKNGNVLLGPVNNTGERAEAAMQTMPSTQNDPGYGVAPAKDNSVEEKNRVGRDYWVAMLKEYGNDPAKAWAAYNWGPGSFNAALKKAEKEGQPWINYVPEETRKYVQKNMRQLETGGGRTVLPPLAEGLARVRARVLETAGDNPEQLAAATEAYAKDHEMLKKSMKERSDNAAAQAISRMQAGETWALLPNELKSEIDPKEIDSVRKAAVNTTTDYARYDTYARNPALWAQKSAPERALEGAYLAPQQIKELDDMVAASNEIDTTLFTKLADERLAIYGYDVDTKDADEKAEIGQQRAFMSTVILDAQRAAGKKMNYAEMSKALETVSREMIQGRGKQVRSLDIKKPSDIPAAVRSTMRDQAEKDYGRAVSDQELVFYYRLDQMRRNRMIQDKARKAFNKAEGK